MKHLDAVSDAERIMAEVDAAIERASALLDRLALANRASHTDTASLDAMMAMQDPARRQQILAITGRIIHGRGAPADATPGRRPKVPRDMI